MECKSSERLLPEYIEGTLSAKQAGLLRLHLGKCVRCQKELESFEKTIRLASNLPIQYPSPEVWEDFWPQLRRHIQQSQSSKKNRVPFWGRGYAWKIAGPACLLIGFLSLWGIWHFGGFKAPMSVDTSALGSLIAPSISQISMKQLQEQLNLELQRTDATLAWGDESSLVDEIRSQELTVSSDLVDQMVKVIAAQIDLEYLDDEEFTDLLSSMNDKSTTLAALN